MNDPRYYILDTLSEGEVSKPELYEKAVQQGYDNNYEEVVHELLENGEIDRTITGFKLKD